MKTLLKHPLVIVILAGFVIFLAIFLTYPPEKPVRFSASTPALHNQEQVRAGLPIRLKIPKIDVDAPLDYVGLTSKGYLGVPAGPANAGWYAQGPRPGEKGDAVIDGHFGWKDNIPAVFDNLHTLQKGDSLYVEDGKGLTTTFVVRELRTYGQSEDASSVFVTRDAKAHLNLITCQGTWSETQQSYSDRLVVFADRKN